MKDYGTENSCAAAAGETTAGPTVDEMNLRHALPLVTAVAATALVGCGDEPRQTTAQAATATPSQATTPARRDRPTLARTTDAPVRTRTDRPRVRVLAGGLVVPWDIAFLPDGRSLVTERPGRLRIVSAKGRLQRSVAATVPTQAQGEGGLLGVAIDPDFADGRRFVYLYVTTSDGMQVQRWRMGGDRLTKDGTPLRGIAAGAIHDSGRLRFGPDKALYVATGDAGRRQLAQDRGSLNGKILRLTRSQYRGRTRRPERYAIGLRNPQGLSWQPGSGRLVATDHGASGFDGPSGDDEVNVIRRGANYGWPLVRGRNHGRFEAPAQVYSRTIAPSGATFVTRGDSEWTGDLVLAALKGRALHRLRFDGTRVVRDQTLFAGRYGRLRAVVEAPDGTLWVTTSNRDSYGSRVSRADDRILQVLPPRR